MSAGRRLLAGALLVALVVAVGLQGVRWRDRLLAGRLLHQAELISVAVATGRAPGQYLAGNLEVLRHAATLDPVEVGIPIARGSQHLLLASPEAAIDAYRAALALEPRPEVYLNLGRAELAAGSTEDARRDFLLAVRLDPGLAEMVPPAGR